MREIIGHAPGRVYLAVLLLSVVGMMAFIIRGGLETAAGEEPFLLFGWMTMSLTVGVAFVIVWLIAYLIYFFFFWPYR